MVTWSYVYIYMHKGIYAYTNTQLFTYIYVKLLPLFVSPNTGSFIPHSFLWFLFSSSLASVELLKCWHSLPTTPIPCLFFWSSIDLAAIVHIFILLELKSNYNNVCSCSKYILSQSQPGLQLALTPRWTSHYFIFTVLLFPKGLVFRYTHTHTHRGFLMVK